MYRSVRNVYSPATLFDIEAAFQDSSPVPENLYSSLFFLRIL